ncbi:MAG: methyltransferase domain-containing protein [Nostocales cyanobacterium 94392]|nr:methyltransferase domain-containing protein [Nostocales cyanobacterium 94392]
MTNIHDLDYLQRTLRQFERKPFPNVPIEKSPKEDIKKLYHSSFVTAIYRRDRKVLTNLENHVMLDVACGTGVTTLELAFANPGAKIVGIDISPESIKVAQKRMKYHHISNCEFYVIAIEELHSLGQKFDYINASDVLYLLPHLGQTLQCLGDVLNEKGIIRGNLHSYYQRLPYYRCQELFKQIGLMEDVPKEQELNFVRVFFESLNDQTSLKRQAWGDNFNKNDDERLLCNHLLLNDKGFTIPQLLEALEFANLELFSMVDWRDWDWRKLFKKLDNLPEDFMNRMECANLGEQLSFYELVEPNKRLLDFWCGHSQAHRQDSQSHWQDINPEKIKVYLHPCLKSDAFRKAVLESDTVAPLNLGDFFDFLIKEAWIEKEVLSAIFVPLLEDCCSLKQLIDRHFMISGIDPITLNKMDYKDTEKQVLSMIKDHEGLGLLMVST